MRPDNVSSSRNHPRVARPANWMTKARYCRLWRSADDPTICGHAADRSPKRLAVRFGREQGGRVPRGTRQPGNSRGILIMWTGDRIFALTADIITAYLNAHAVDAAALP